MAIAPGKPHPAAACVRPFDQARPNTCPSTPNSAMPEPTATPNSHVGRLSEQILVLQSCQPYLVYMAALDSPAVRPTITPDIKHCLG